MPGSRQRKSSSETFFFPCRFLWVTCPGRNDGLVLRKGRDLRGERLADGQLTDAHTRAYTHKRTCVFASAYDRQTGRQAHSTQTVTYILVHTDLGAEVVSRVLQTHIYSHTPPAATSFRLTAPIFVPPTEAVCVPWRRGSPPRPARTARSAPRGRWACAAPVVSFNAQCWFDG